MSGVPDSAALRSAFGGIEALTRAAGTALTAARDAHDEAAAALAAVHRLLTPRAAASGLPSSQHSAAGSDPDSNGRCALLEQANSPGAIQGSNLHALIVSARGSWRCASTLCAVTTVL